MRKSINIIVGSGEKLISGGAGIARRVSNLVFSIGIGQRISQSMTMLLIPLWVLHEHGSPFAIGCDVAAVSVAPMIFAIPIGAAADRIGSRNIVMVGAVAAAITTVASVAAGNVWLFGFWQMVAGLGRSAAWIGAQASVTREEPAGLRRARRIGYLSFSAQFGNFAGPFLAGLLVSQANITTAFVVAAAAIAFVSLSITAAPIVHPEPGKAAPTPAKMLTAGAIGHFGRAFALLRMRTFRLIIVSSVVRLTLIAVRNSFYVVYLHRLGWSPVYIGLVLSIGSAASAATAALSGSLHARFSTQKLLYLSVFVMAAMFLVIPFTSAMLVQLSAMIVFGVGNGISQTAIIVLLAKATPAQDQGLAVGLRTSVNRAVQVSAPLLFGSLVGLIMLPTLLFSLSLACLVSLVGSAWILRARSSGTELGT